MAGRRMGRKPATWGGDRSPAGPAPADAERLALQRERWLERRLRKGAKKQLREAKPL